MKHQKHKGRKDKMARRAKIKRPAASDVDIRGLMMLMQNFDHMIRQQMKKMLRSDELVGWDDPANEEAFSVALTSEMNPLKIAVLCAVVSNFEDVVEEEEIEPEE
jgi:hypothetical protein